MPTPQKEAVIAELSDALGNSGFTVLTNYRGLSVAQFQELRRQLREHNAEYRVTKNTLTRFAVRANDLEELEEFLEGPTAIMFAYDDPAQPAKVLRDFVRRTRILELKAGVLDGAVVSADRVEAIADLPSRDELLGKIVGGVASPLYGLVNVMTGPSRSLLYALQARANQLEAA